MAAPANEATLGCPQTGRLADSLLVAAATALLRGASRVGRACVRRRKRQSSSRKVATEKPAMMTIQENSARQLIVALDACRRCRSSFMSAPLRESGLANKPPTA